MAALALVRRILSRLLDAESSEHNPHYKTDYRIARLTVALAARGTKQPHVLATYQVLGVHPDKVWPAIVAQRKAQLGNYYSHFYDEHDLPRFDEFGPLLPPKKPQQSVRPGRNELFRPDEFGPPLPPKKPPQSVRSPGRSERRQAVGNEGPAPELELGRSFGLKNRRRVPPKARAATGFEAPEMASTQTAYRNSDPANSAKTAVSTFPRIELVRQSNLPSGIRDLLLAYMSKDKMGNELWMSIERLRVEMVRPTIRGKMISRRAVQYRIKRALDMQVIKKVREPGVWVPYGGKRKFRRTATYQLVSDKLPLPRPSWEEYAKTLPVSDPVAPIADQPGSKPPAPVKAKVQASSGRISLSKVELKYLYAEVPKLMKGCTRVRELNNWEHDIGADDKRYRAPMGRDEAIREACRQSKMQIPEDLAIKALDDWKFKPKGEA